MDKFKLTKIFIEENIKPREERYKLLDVGCRDCALKPYVSQMVDYQGVDLFQNDQSVSAYDAAIISTAHSAVNHAQLTEKIPCVVDTRNCLGRAKRHKGTIVKS